MGKLTSIKVTTFRKFLEQVGCKFYRVRASHEIWGRKDLTRPITFRNTKKEIEPFHIRTNLKTLGISVDQFLQIIKEL
ncbi:MAG: type II toxin-antitoxin system HicA family toxin [Cytophagales bacterium]|nr:type II toxin-antitoxin system HicA family toxin [Cytophagales bacterium]